MISDNHTFFSDPHIADPLQWIAGNEDPMLLQEELISRNRKKRRERIQLLFGTFFLVLIITATSAEYNHLSYTNEKKIAQTLHEQIIRKDPIPLFPFPELSAHAYLVKFIGNQNFLMRQREWKALAPASLTKMLTATIAIEHLLPDTKITISKRAKLVGEKMSKSLVGESFFRDDMIRLALVESANDAAYAIAEEIEKEKTGNNQKEGLPEFMRIMNEKAVRIGMENSYFKNPTGLDEDSHYSSAKDLGKLAEYIWEKNPKLWEITAFPNADLVSAEHHVYALENTNELLQEFPALKGGKTGLTDHAKGALILLYPVHPSATALVIILGSENRFEDGRKIIRWLEEAF